MEIPYCRQNLAHDLRAKIIDQKPIPMLPRWMKALGKLILLGVVGAVAFLGVNIAMIAATMQALGEVDVQAQQARLDLIQAETTVSAISADSRALAEIHHISQNSRAIQPLSVHLMRELSRFGRLRVWDVSLQNPQLLQYRLELQISLTEGTPEDVFQSVQRVAEGNGWRVTRGDSHFPSGAIQLEFYFTPIGDNI